MYEFHQDKSTYFSYQYRTAKEYIIPFLLEHNALQPGARVLEIGCAEAGVLKAFTENNHPCMGIELQPWRVELAKKFMAEELEAGQVEFLQKNIYDVEMGKDIVEPFDLIILKDVIEHIHDQARFMRQLPMLMAPGGKVFFGFPPWQMPFGGHQQVATKKLLSVMPYYHLLPTGLYRSILKWGGENQQRINDLLEIKETGISIERFERILREEGYNTHARQLFLFNPIYKYKFNLEPRKQISAIGAIPYFRNFLTTCAYYIVDQDKT